MHKTRELGCKLYNGRYCSRYYRGIVLQLQRVIKFLGLLGEI